MMVHACSCCSDAGALGLDNGERHPDSALCTLRHLGLDFLAAARRGLRRDGLVRH